MGRKQNPLITEYFERGAKLEDASNRYNHTCKKCGEEFPKGRLESLVAHLTKKCTSISLAERTKIVLQLHQLVDADALPKNPSKGRTIELPYSPSRQQNFDGLNVLAEASRRVGATDHSQGPANPSGAEGQNLPLDPALEADNFPASFLTAPDDAFGIRANGSSAQGTAPPLPSIFSYMPQQQSSPQDDPGNVSGLETSLPSHLSSIAASANNMMPMEPDIDMSNDNISTTLFNHLGGLNGMMNGQNISQARPSVSWSNLGQDQETELDELPDAESAQNNNSQANEHRTNNGPRPIAINPNSRQTHFVSETGTSTKSPRPKVRGRFNADRRKEVQQVRKQGACIRCRMLKKPCSGETPCSTCKSVESARLWKQPCIRTRIADEFTLYSAGLHSTLAFHDTNNIKALVGFESLSGRIEVFHFAEDAPIVTLGGLKAQHSLPFPSLGLQFVGTSHQHLPTSETIIMLDHDGDDVAAKIEQYVRELAPTLFEKEPPSFIKATLFFASKVSKEKEDDLLFRVLELWTATNTLADVTLIWNVAVNNGDAPLPANSPMLQTSVGLTSLNSQKPINDTTSPYSYALLCSQLRSAVEKRAAILGKSIMNDIERRLLQRHTAGRFETFLASVILLNCVERFCWLFSTWHSDGTRHSQWPLERRPEPYADEGERFADVLNMLLKMRSLAPRTSAQIDSGVLMPIDDEDGLATQYFTEINISQSFLDRSTAAQFNPKDSRSLDGKYCARVLQPQNCYT